MPLPSPAMRGLAEAAQRGLPIATHHRHRPRSHVLLFAHHPAHAVAGVVGERLLGMFQQPVRRRSITGSHGRRQVDQPLGVDGEAAHHLQGGGGVLRAHGHVATQPSGDGPFAGDVVQIQQLVVGLLRAQRGAGGSDQGTRRLGVAARRRHRDQFVLRVAQGAQAAPEHAAGVDADGAVEPLGDGYRGVAVDHPRAAAVLPGPRVPHGQAVLVALAGGLTVQGEGAHGAGGTPLQFLLHARVRHHQTAIVQLVVAHQGVDELGYLGAPLRGFRRKLLQGLRQAVVQLYVAAAQLAQLLHVMVARHAQGVPGGDCIHHQAQARNAARPAVHQVAEKDQPPAPWVGHLITTTGRLLTARQQHGGSSIAMGVG